MQQNNGVSSLETQHPVSPTVAVLEQLDQTNTDIFIATVPPVACRDCAGHTAAESQFQQKTNYSRTALYTAM